MVFRLNDPGFLTDPAPMLARMRAQGPVVRGQVPILGKVWLVTDDALLREAFKDTGTFVRNSANAGGRSLERIFWWLPPFMRPLLKNVNQTDGADHARLRALVTHAFARAEMDDLRPALRDLASGLLDACPIDRPVDLMAGLARPLPLLAICVLLGIPSEDRTLVAKLSAPLSHTDGFVSFFAALPALWRLVRYFRADFARVRRTARPGLIQALLAAEADGSRLTEDEVLAMVVALFIAGHETTANLVGNAIVTLLENPGTAAALRTDPAGWAMFIEEEMRYSSPVMFTNVMYVTRKTVLGGVSLDRGDRVMPLLIAANRDPARFAQPDEFDARRRPNAHLGFGFGPHVCIGMQLARAETHETLALLIARFPQARLVQPSADLPRSRRIGMHGFAQLPVRLRP